jgi:hypothetical protein
MIPVLSDTVMVAQAQAPVAHLPWLGPLIGVLGGAAVAIFAEPLRRHLFSPKLRLEFSDSADCFPLTPMRHGTALLQARYVRVRVVNPSQWVARACRVYLTNVDVVGADGICRPTVYSDAIQLAWSVSDGVEFGGKDLPSKLSSFVDVMYVNDGGNAIVPRTRSWPFRYDELFHSPGTYRLTLRISGDGVKASSVRILVTWNGLWNTLSVALGR